MMLWRTCVAKSPNIPSQVEQNGAGNSYSDYGLVEFLAVASRAGDAGAEARNDAGGATEAGSLRVECQSLPLPYAFPD